MANYSDVLYIANNSFCSISSNGKFDKSAFIDIVTITIDNDKMLLNPILECKEKSIRGYVWKAIIDIFNNSIKWYELKCVSGVNSNQLKKALETASGMPYTELIKPIIDYYIKERETE